MASRPACLFLWGEVAACDGKVCQRKVVATMVVLEISIVLDWAKEGVAKEEYMSGGKSFNILF